MITAYQGAKMVYPPSSMEDMRKCVIRHCQEFVDESTLKLVKQGFTNIRYRIEPSDMREWQPSMRIIVWGDPPETANRRRYPWLKRTT